MRVSGPLSFSVCSSALQHHQTSLSVLGHDSVHVAVAARRVISHDPARPRQQRRQSASHPDDATFGIHDLDGGPDNAPERGIGEARPWRASRRHRSASERPSDSSRTRKQISSKVGFLNFHTKRVCIFAVHVAAAVCSSSSGRYAVVLWDCPQVQGTSTKPT